MRRTTLVVALVALLGACSSGAKQAATTSTGGTGTAAANAPGCATATTAPGASGAKDTTSPGDIPDNQAFVAYSPPAGGYTVQVPEGWARTAADAAVTFTDKFNTINVELVAAPQAPTTASASSGEVPKIAASTSCYEPGKVSTVSRKGGTGVLVTYRQDSKPDPVTGKVVRQAVERYEFWSNSREAVITLSSAVGADNVDPWKRVTDSFAWR
jgi:hypothetical protein